MKTKNERPERLDCQSNQRVESPPEIEAFLDEYEKLCGKHGMTIAHEDGHGRFIIERYQPDNIKRVRDAAFNVPALKRRTPPNEE